ncbi:zinc ion binding [Rhizina undulata]
MDSTSILQEFLKCSVCLGTLVNPMSLPCTHTFCRECLVQTYTAVGQLIHCLCPICQALSETVKRNPSVACLVEEYQTINGVEIPEDLLKEHHYGDLNMAELFEAKHDRGSIIVEDNQVDEDEPKEEEDEPKEEEDEPKEEEDEEAEAEGHSIDEFEMAIPVPAAPPGYAYLATLVPSLD